MPAALRTGEGWRIGLLACWLQRSGAPLHQRPDALAVLAAAAAPCRLELQGDDTAVRAGPALLETLGAAAAARVARQRLHAHGLRNIARGPVHRTRNDPLGLTPREREVLGTRRQVGEPSCPDAARARGAEPAGARPEQCADRRPAAPQ